MTSTSGNRAAACSNPASTTDRSGTTRDCELAQAPSCDARGRLAKYSSVSARSALRTAPHTTTCRCSGYHGKTRLAYGLVSASAPLRER